MIDLPRIFLVKYLLENKTTSIVGYLKILRRKVMDKYVCNICGYIYDPEVGDPDSGIAAGTKFEDIPEDWVCPVCGVGKGDFSKAE